MVRKILVKTVRGMENVAASWIEDVAPGCRAKPKPDGYLGLVLVECPGDCRDVQEKLLKEIPELEKVLVVEREARAVLGDICEAAREVAERSLEPGETFAVRTTRRGKHNFTSLDVNVRAGALIQEIGGNPVDLSYPDKVIWIEIVGGRAFISVTEGGVERKKKYPGKPEVRSLLRKIEVGQMPYLGDPVASKKMGIRIGRNAQTFELKSLYVTPLGKADGLELAYFLQGVLEGIRSRYLVQKKTYPWKPNRVKVFVHDLYQFVREKGDHAIIVSSTRGKYINDVRDEISRILREEKRIVVLVGAREGIPTGIFRFADLVVDVAPGITLSTDSALPSIVTAMITVAVEGGR